MPPNSGRKREANRIRRANRAAAVGRLMLGEFDNWSDFLQADVMELENLPRRNLKSGRTDVKQRLSPEIRKFCNRNFQKMTEKKLSDLYEEVKAFRGVEYPLKDFERLFSSIKPGVLKGCPAHLTVCISLWGLQFKFPEAELSKDLIEAIQLATVTQEELELYKTYPHTQLRMKRDEVSSLIRRVTFVSRSVILNCFNLIEAYLNGLAWDYIQKNGLSNLSKRKVKLLQDTFSVSIRDKLLKYPEIVTGKPLWSEEDPAINDFITKLKPYRDSLVHPSPFSTPEKFGGYDKLQQFYRVDYDTSIAATDLVVKLIQRIHLHVYSEKSTKPKWMQELVSNISSITGVKAMVL